MLMWKDQGWQWNFTWCGVGTRELPEELYPLIHWIGCCMALMGGVLCTGDAIGADEEFLVEIKLDDQIKFKD